MEIDQNLLLPLGAIVFYLADCCSLLEAKHIVLLCNKKRWRVDGGSDFKILHKRPLILNPITPFGIVFNGNWINDINEKASDEDSINAFKGIISPLRFASFILLFILLILFPLFCFTYGAGFSLLVILVANYLIILFSCAYIYKKRKELGLENKKALSLIFEFIFCPPFAINMVRKLSMEMNIIGSPLLFAANHFEESDKKEYINIVIKRTKENLTFCETGTEKFLKYKELENKYSALL